MILHRKFFVVLLLIAGTTCAHTQSFSYEPSQNHPYGQKHPDAPEQLLDYSFMIGSCKCNSERRSPDGTWPEEPVEMLWKWKYIMNGWAIQDETLKEDGSHAGSIRQFIADSSKWYVHYYSNQFPSTSLNTWTGEKVGEEIILNLEQKAPNGMDGWSRLTFYDMSEEGYKWKGEWVSLDESIRYPFWRIECRRIP